MDRKHDPLPWKFVNENRYLVAANGVCVARMEELGDYKENAALIIKALAAWAEAQKEKAPYVPLAQAIDEAMANAKEESDD